MSKDKVLNNKSTAKKPIEPCHGQKAKGNREDAKEHASGNPSAQQRVKMNTDNNNDDQDSQELLKSKSIPCIQGKNRSLTKYKKVHKGSGQ